MPAFVVDRYRIYLVHHSFPTRRSSDLAANMLAGGLCWWLLLLVLSSLFLPGGSYLFTWPLLFSLLGLGVRFALEPAEGDRKSTCLNSSHRCISYAVFCLKKKKYKTKDS